MTYFRDKILNTRRGGHLPRDMYEWKRRRAGKSYKKPVATAHS